MTLVLMTVAVIGATSLMMSTIVAAYSVWQYRRRGESVFARNARLDREHVDALRTQPVVAHPAGQNRGVRGSV